MSKPEQGRKAACLVGRMLEPKRNEKRPQGVGAGARNQSQVKNITHIGWWPGTGVLSSGVERRVFAQGGNLVLV